MAFLMLLHEKMRLTRKKNSLTYKSLRAGHKLERITKNIANIQKIYGKKESQIDSQVSIWQKQQTLNIQQQSYMGGYSGYGSFGNMGFMGGMMSGLTSKLMQSAFNKFFDGTDRSELFEKMGISGGLSAEDQTAVQNAITTGKGTTGLSDAAASIYNMFQQNVSQMQAQMQYQAQQAIAQVEQYATHMKEMMKEQLEEEQEEMLLPLKEEETEMQLEKDTTETQLALVKEELDSIKQSLSEEAKDVAPRFGLT